MDQDKEFALKVAAVSGVIYAIMIKLLPGLLETQTGMLGEIRDVLRQSEKSMSAVIITVLISTMIATVIVVNNEGLM